MRRRAELSKLIDAHYLDANQEPPDSDMLAAMAGRWDRHLERKRVPTRRLQEIYDRAVDNRAANPELRRGPFSVFDLLQAWDEISSEAALLNRKAEGLPRCEHGPDEEPELKIVALKTRRNVTVPCPVCRPEEFERALEKANEDG